MQLRNLLRSTAGGAVAAALLAGGAPPAGASIVGGQAANVVQCRASADVGEGGAERDDAVTAFLERRNHVLAAPLAVDATGPLFGGANYDEPGDLAGGTVAGGTNVDVYLFRSDAIGDGGGVAYSADVTFDRPILGVIVRSEGLRATDAVIGHPGVTYSQQASYATARGYELVPNYEWFSIDLNGRTLRLRPRTSGSTDEIRVLTSGDPTAGANSELATCDGGAPADDSRVVGSGTPANDAGQPGYRLLTAAGGEYVFGARTFLGNTTPPQPIVAGAETPSGDGYWAVTANGEVLTRGDAPHLGSMAGRPLNAPIVGFAATPSGGGYWLLGRDGGIFSFGDAVFHGSTGAMRLNQPILGIATTPSGGGYWLVARDGGIFSFGNAVFHGSTGAMRLNQPIIGMASAPDGNGYWLAAADGGIFSFGTATFLGSTGDIRLLAPMVAILS